MENEKQTDEEQAEVEDSPSVKRRKRVQEQYNEMLRRLARDR
jgi:hypothetical protein